MMRGAPYEKEPDVQAKVNLGAKVGLTNQRGDSALMIAARSANLAAMKVLFAAKAKVDSRNKIRARFHPPGRGATL
jgi:hypothetical protein